MSSTSTPSTNNGLGLPVLIAIGVGACVVVGFTIVLGAALWRRRYAQRRERRQREAADFRFSKIAEDASRSLLPSHNTTDAGLKLSGPSYPKQRGDSAKPLMHERVLSTIVEDDGSYHRTNEYRLSEYRDSRSIGEAASLNTYDTNQSALSGYPPDVEDLKPSAQPRARVESSVSGMNEALGSLPPLQIPTSPFPSSAIPTALPSSVNDYSPDSVYSDPVTPIFQLSASASTESFQASSDAPPVPALPEFTIRRQPSLKRVLDHETENQEQADTSLRRMDTIAIGNLLKARATRSSPPSDGLARSFTKVSRIERDGSIKSVHTPRVRTRRPAPLPPKPAHHAASKQRSTPSLRASSSAGHGSKASSSSRRMDSLGPAGAGDAAIDDSPPSLSTTPSSTPSPGWVPVTPPVPPLPSFSYLPSSFPSNATPRAPNALTSAFRASVTSAAFPSPPLAFQSLDMDEPPVPSRSWYAMTPPLNVPSKSSYARLSWNDSSQSHAEVHHDIMGDAGVVVSHRVDDAIGKGERVDSMRGSVGRRDYGRPEHVPGVYMSSIEQLEH